jgi:hypothetical protein
MALSLGLSACGSFHPAKPEEFAQYSRGILNQGSLRAVSPDGVLFTVRRVANKPRADLAFWSEAMKTRMVQAGYRVVSDSACTMKGAGGRLLALAAPVGNEDYFYWIAFVLSPSGDHIVVAEATGESKRFLARREAIRKAISESGF